MNRISFLLIPVLLFALTACAPVSGSISSSVTQPPASLPATLPYVPSIAIPLSPMETSTPLPVPSTVFPPIATAVFPVTTPQAGLANALGRVLWNDQPVAEAQVKLCTGLSDGVPGIGDCNGLTASTKTDAQGIYSFLNIPPARYLVLVAWPGEEAWFYFKSQENNGGFSSVSGSSEPEMADLTAGQVFVFADMSIYKSDLKLTAPADQAVLREIPTLTWQSYPGAAFYVVTLGFSGTGQITMTNSFKPGGVIQNCDYPWKVEAYNNRAEKMSEAWIRSTFYMIGQVSSCHVLFTSPAAGAQVPAGQPIQFSWQPNALATEYEVYISGAADPFVRVTSPSYSLAQGLPAGQDDWTITAYMEDQEIASSDYGHFTVVEGSQAANPAGPAPTGTAIPARIQANPLVLIPAGPFQMGGSKCMVLSGGNCLKWVPGDDDPPHTVTLDAFKINAYEVTEAQYADCVAAGMCRPLNPGNPDSPSEHYGLSSYENFPVTQVTWFDASAYCIWVGGRLPSEAEWEKAARGGLAGQMYPWGNQEAVCKYGAKNGAQTGRCEPGGTLAVGSFASNGYGLFDMVGNLAEWVNDWYQADYYTTSPASNPTGPESGTDRVIRGGSYETQPSPYGSPLNVYVRGYSTPAMVFWNIGFRCAANAQ